jgi:hypothetical protein
MWNLLEIVAEINIACPQLYRGWAFLTSKKFRKKCIQEWKQSNILSITFDILMSLLFMGIEIWCAYGLYMALSTREMIST